MSNRRRRQEKARRRLVKMKIELLFAPANERFVTRLAQFEALQVHYGGMLRFK